MTKLIAMLGIVAMASMFAPQPATAEECTRAYEKCLNDTYDTEGWTRVLADFECFAAYIGCVRALI
jgi:hypothetical protein